MTNEKPGFILNLALFAPSKLFGAVASLRARLYDSSALEIVDTGVPVISIGNLTAGGTGKTPITSFLTDDLRARGFECAIVSRGYGATERGPALVPAHGEARQFGDEPTWLASRHPDVSVVIGGRRPEAIDFLKKARQTKGRFVVLADDAFQHRRLKRDLDIVILDATEPRWHYSPLPQGRMRESFDALKRADFIFLSKTNLAESAQLEWLRAQVRPFETSVIEFRMGLSGFVALVDDASTDSLVTVPQKLTARRPVLVSGIARPKTFEQLVDESANGIQILKHFIFPDHHAFTKHDLEIIETRARELGADAILVTEKDATKLRDWRPKLPCYVSRLVAQPLTSLGEFHAAVDRLI